MLMENAHLFDNGRLARFTGAEQKQSVCFLVLLVELIQLLLNDVILLALLVQVTVRVRLETQFPHAAHLSIRTESGTCCHFQPVLWLTFIVKLG